MTASCCPLGGGAAAPFPSVIINGVLIHLVGVGLPSALAARAAAARAS